MPQQLQSQASLEAHAASAPQPAGPMSEIPGTDGEELPGVAERRSVRFSSDTQRGDGARACTLASCVNAPCSFSAVFAQAGSPSAGIYLCGSWEPRLVSELLQPCMVATGAAEMPS